MTLRPRVGIGFALVVLAMVVVPVSSPDAATPGQRLANPASTNCVGKGGKLKIERDGKGGQFGLCVFPGNLQCEEWALMRGDCPVGGIKVTGFATQAARYCAITGGTYRVTMGSSTSQERGTCTFKNGRACAATAYYSGACSPEQSSGSGAAKTIRARFGCAGGKSIEAVFVNGAKNSVNLALSDGRRLSLPQAMSASGARYANGKETIVFWNKGDAAFIEENGKTTFTDCVTRR